MISYVRRAKRKVCITRKRFSKCTFVVPTISARLYERLASVVCNKILLVSSQSLFALVSFVPSS